MFGFNIDRYSFTVLILILSVINLTVANLEVNTKTGKVKGVEVKSILKDEKFYSFMGIPYAEPPLGKLRFMPPKPHQGWQNVLEATKEKNSCAQFYNPVRRVKNFGFHGTEDCLTLSVHTPKLPEQNPDPNLPTIVFLSNEQFRISSNGSKDYGPDFFMKEDVILVTVNHRLGIFGFLSFEDDLLPGNNGIRDVILALEWLKENIGSFGGDPSRVTLMGHEEGAVVAEILLQTPKAKGLFSNVILQSGTVYNSALFTGKAKHRAMTLAKYIEQEASSSSFLLKRFADVETRVFAENEQSSVHADEARAMQRGIFPFGPVIEHDHPDAIITSYPEEWSLAYDVPIMIGQTSREGLYGVGSFLSRPQFLTYAERDFLLMQPTRTGFHWKINDEIYNKAVGELKKFYFEEGYVKVSKPGEYVTYIGDAMRFYAADYGLRKYVNESNADVFYYLFDYSGELNMIKSKVLENAINFDGTWGATVGDELCYLFLCKPIRKAYKQALEDEDSEEITVLNNMVRMWTNFAKTGNPTPPGADFVWKPATKENKDCLVISDELHMETKLYEDRMQFWDNFLAKYKEMAIDGVVKDLKDEL